MLVIVAFVLTSCGGGEKAETETTQMPGKQDGLSQDQLVNGIGPISAFTLGPADANLAAKGKEIFDVKCVACHKIDDRLVGPPLRGVLERRSPAFILNMILNPDEMVKKHPEVQSMLAQYYVPMTFQNVSEEDARVILEYLRSL